MKTTKFAQAIEEMEDAMRGILYLEDAFNALGQNETAARLADQGRKIGYAKKMLFEYEEERVDECLKQAMKGIGQTLTALNELPTPKEK